MKPLAGERVEVVEVGPRDGFQIESEIIATPRKIAWINQLAACGFPAMEVASFVSPRALPQMADAEAVLAGIDRSYGVRLRALTPNVRGAERAVAAGVDELVPLVSSSQSHNRSNLNRSIEQSLADLAGVVAVARTAGCAVHGGVSTAFGCPFEGDVAMSSVLELAHAMAALGVEAITLGDTTGMATPNRVTELCRRLDAELPSVRVSLHFHNTRGLGLVNVMAGCEAGVRSFETSVGGLGGCPFAPGASGNVCTEDLVNLLEELELDCGIELQALSQAARDIEAGLGRTLPGQVMKAGPRLTLHPTPEPS